MLLLIVTLLELVNLFRNITNLLYDQLPPFLRLLIPFTLTLYLFSYKERKEVTYSYLKQNRLNKHTYKSIISTVVLLLCLFNHFYYNESGVFFNLFFLLVFVFWVSCLFLNYVDLFNSVNIFQVKEQHLALINRLNLKIQQYNLSQKQILDYRDNLFIEKMLQQENESSKKRINTFNMKEKFRRRNYVKSLINFDIAIQILTQILLSKTKYNLSKDVSSLLNDLTKELNTFLENMEDETLIENLVTLNIVNEYQLVYTTILKNLEMLIESSLKNARSEDLHKLLDLLKGMTVPPFSLRVSVYNLYLHKNSSKAIQISRELSYLRKSHIKTIKYVTSILHSHGYNGDLTLIRNLINLSKEGNEHSTGVTPQELIFTLQLAIILEAINKDNVKLLTDIVNITLENKNTSNEKCITKIFILSTVKAIEQGHYKCAGHLIKMIVKISHDEVIEVLQDVHQHFEKKQLYSEKEFYRLLENNIDLELAEEFMLTMPFSQVSFEYCFSKFVYLLELQYNFIYENSIQLFDNLPLETKKEYIQEKVKGLNKEYGLIILRNDLINKLIEPQPV
ncbi:hypothetical protein ABEX27_17530 [Bacillus velezensis]